MCASPALDQHPIQLEVRSPEVITAKTQFDQQAQIQLSLNLTIVSIDTEVSLIGSDDSSQ